MQQYIYKQVFANAHHANSLQSNKAKNDDYIYN